MELKSESEFEHSRLDRIAPIMRVCGSAWAVFGLYYLCTGRPENGSLCLVEAAFSFLFAHLSKQFPPFQKMISHTYVGLVAAGLMAGCYLSSVSAANTQMFFACVVLIASFLLGQKWAWAWAAITISFVIINDLVLPGLLPSHANPSPLDKTLGYMTLITVITCCAILADVTTYRYTKRLEATSKALRERTLKLDHLVGVDVLTSLPNRHQFYEDTAEAIVRADKSGIPMCVCLVDMAKYKQFSERVGRIVGDELLREVALRIRKKVDVDSRVYRIGGDKFVIVADDSRSPASNARSLAEDILSNICENAFEVRDRVFNLRANIGVAIYPHHASDSCELLAALDAAVQEAKNKADSIAFYEPRMSEFVKRQERLDEQLTRAVQHEEFKLFFQPQVDVQTNRIVGAEALLRWERSGQFVSPVWFIPQLEASGQIAELGRWVLNHATHQVKLWQLNENENLRISVNVSPSQFHDRRFYDEIVTALQFSGLSADSLDLEITEAVFVDDSKVAVRRIEKFRKLGVTVSIDDFGTQYSSLRYLQGLPVNRLKIDRSFLKGIPKSDDGTIASSVISLGHSLGLTVVAEGIETQEQLDYIQANECDEYQGYLFSRPLPPEEFRELLRSDTHSESRPSPV